MSREDVAWAAGLFEGEGTIGASGLSARRIIERPRARPTIATKLAMTDESTVRRFGQVVGVGTVSGPYFSNIKGQRPMYRWCATSDNARRVLRLLWPWLGDRRRAKAVAVWTITAGVQYPLPWGTDDQLELAR